MVEFVSLLLGLTLGPQTITLAVEGPVARVELTLDRRPVATLTGPPWSARIDFGERLAPRLLEAVAFDADGSTVDSARRFVNYARSNYEAVLVLEPLEAGVGARGRVVWQTILGREPRAIELTLDGREVEVARDGGFELPAVDRREAHVLSALLRFEGGESAAADLVFGGVHGESVTSALTAVPLLVPPGAELPPVDRMADWFRAGGGELRAFAVTEGPAQLMIVRDPDLGHLTRRLRRELSRAKALPLPRVVAVGDAVQFVPLSPLAGHPGLFRAVQVGPAKNREGLWPLLDRLHPRQPVTGGREAWSALAAAARGAVQGNRRRAALLLLGGAARDKSRLTPAQVVGYLQSVRVPHFLWASRAADLPALDPALGANLYVGAEGLARLFDDLDRSLREQRIVWLEGAHFPAEVEVTGRLPAGFALAH